MSLGVFALYVLKQDQWKRTAPMIKPTCPADIADLQTVLDGTGLFPSDLLPDMLAPALAGETDAFWLTLHHQGTAAGFCYITPEELTTGTWNMRALAIRPDLQGQGLGAQLVRKVEQTLRDKGQRIVIVDTSGTDDFAATRRFYAQNGYEQEARIRDFWATGDDKVIFRKALTQSVAP
jgi:GNAT superfamily N-acetyltransferase